MATKKKWFNTVYVSDIHLGTPASQADKLCDWLETIDCNCLYLVGDIIDLWYMARNGFKLPHSHVRLIRQILKMARKKVTVRFVIGNHDEALRQFVDLLSTMDFGRIEIANFFMDEAIDGRQIWVVHGDQFDRVIRKHKWLCYLGDIAYNVLLASNKYLNAFRTVCGLPYWSLANYMKMRVKMARGFIESFENALATAAKKNGSKVVVCGHIHHAEEKVIDGIQYYNTGDWVESCTAIVETEDGDFQILRLHEFRNDLDVLNATACFDNGQRHSAKGVDGA